jgi:hypothetical protein
MMSIHFNALIDTFRHVPTFLSVFFILSTTPGICHTVTVICRYRGRVGTGFSVLWVA